MIDPVRGVRPANSKEYQKLPPKTPSETAKAPESVSPDSVEISDGGKILKKLAEIPSARSERVAEIKAMLAKGGYPETSKIDTAIDKLLG